MVAKFVRIQQQVSAPHRGSELRWQTLPNCDRLEVWETMTAAPSDGDNMALTSIRIFHVPFAGLLARGQRLTYLGRNFAITRVSNSSKLVGLELRCEPL